MTAMLDRPLFTWITLEHRATLDGRITVHYEPYLVLDRIAVNAFVAVVGARKWRILETLALLSEPDPSQSHRRVVKANIPDLLAVCAGPDVGWSKSTMSSVIRSLEVDGYLVRVLGAKLGRGAGQDDTTWILADGLFALPQADTVPVTSSEIKPPQDEATKNMYTESYVTQKLDSIPQASSLTNNGIQISEDQNLRRHHDRTWMNSPSMETMEPAAYLAEGTTNEILTLAVSRALRHHGWTTDITAAIRKHGLLRIAAFIWYAEQPSNKVKRPGGYIRMRLNEPSEMWPDGWSEGSHIAVSNTGTITVHSPNHTAAMNAVHISTAQVMEIFTSLPGDEQEQLRAAASRHMPEDPKARVEAWRHYLADVFTATGLLKEVS